MTCNRRGIYDETQLCLNQQPKATHVMKTGVYAGQKREVKIDMR